MLTPTDDDSDADLVTDYLDAPTLVNNNNKNNNYNTSTAAKLFTTTTTPTTQQTPTSNIKNYFVSTVDIKEKGGLMSNNDLGHYTNGSGSNHHLNANTITITTPSGQTTNNNHNITNNNNNIINMVPIISVTPHSPNTKYNSILEDSLNHLQSIRESVVQMKNSSAQNTNFGNIGIINPAVNFHFDA